MNKHLEELFIHYIIEIIKKMLQKKKTTYKTISTNRRYIQQEKTKWQEQYEVWKNNGYLTIKQYYYW